MIRYRCPHCATQTVTHERRVGQSSVCKACLKSHQIPADPALWLTETGELLHPPAAAVAVLSATVPDVELPPETPQPVAELPGDSAATLPDLNLSDLVLVPPAHEPEPVVVAVAGETVPVTPQSAAAATQTPPPQPARNPTPRTDRRTTPVSGPRANNETPRPDPAERAYAEPVQLQTQADIAVALTAALTSRMKPAAAPRRDLRPSTAGWMLLTGVGIAFALVALFTDLNYRWPALAIGVAQIAIGYAWIVRLTHLRDPKRGLACAVPPLTFYYLSQRKYAKFRPLWFVFTGTAIAGMAAAAPALADLARPLVAKPVPPAPPPDPAAESKLVQLRKFRDQRAYDSLIEVLELLVKTDTIQSVDAADRAELATELESLCGHPLTDVRVAAMTAFPSWDPTPDAERARKVCLKAIQSPTQEERMCALRLLPEWKDADVARAVQSLIGRPGGETNQAQASLKKIGGAPAEQAALALLKRADNQGTRLIAIDVLENVGGRKAADELYTHAQATDDPAVRNRALAAIDVIEKRLRKPIP